MKASELFAIFNQLDKGLCGVLAGKTDGAVFNDDTLESGRRGVYVTMNVNGMTYGCSADIETDISNEEWEEVLNMFAVKYELKPWMTR